MESALDIEQNVENLQAIKRGYLIGFGNMFTGDTEKGFSFNKNLKQNVFDLLKHDNYFFKSGYMQGVNAALAGKENAYA